MSKNKMRYTLGKYLRKNKIRYTDSSNKLERLRKKAALAAVQTQRVMDRDRWSYERRAIAKINSIRLRLFPELHKLHNAIGYSVNVKPAVLSDAAMFNWYISDREIYLEYWGITDTLDLLHYRAKTEPKAALYLNLLRDIERGVTCGELPEYIYKVR